MVRSTGDADQKGEVGAHKYRGGWSWCEGGAVLCMDYPHNYHWLRKVTRSEVR